MPALTFFTGFDTFASEDSGFTWSNVFTVTTGGAAGAYKAAGFAGAYLAATQANAWFSADAVEWVSVPAASAAPHLDVLYNGTVFLIISTEDFPTSGAGYVAAPPVTAWSGPHPMPFYPVAWGVIGGTFCALKFDGTTATSTDGINWSTAGGPATGGAFDGASVTSFDRSRIINARAADTAGCFYTASTTGWVAVSPSGSWTVDRIGTDETGSTVLASKTLTKQLLRSTDGGATWASPFTLPEFTGTAGPLWLGQAGSFIIPLTATGTPRVMGLRTDDGGASWALSTQTFDPTFSMEGIRHMIYLPEGLPSEPTAFWTNRVKTQETI